MRTLSALLVGFLLLAVPVNGQTAEDLEERIPDLMAQAGITGLSAALIEDGSVTWTGAFGTRDIGTGALVTDETVFEAASLSKPVVAYLTLKLAARGVIDLDAPLWDDTGYVRLDHDERATQITARMVLSHTSGLPNWGGTPITLNHDPGTAWNYSGEGFVFLAEMLERRTGMSLNDLITAEVFDPLGMDQSSFVWRPDYESNAALPHDMLGRVMEKTKPADEVAAASLHTTASDYASFMQAVLSGDGLTENLAEEMLSEQAVVSGWGDSETWAYLSWGLGWGRQAGDRAPAIWHWGDNENFRSFVIAYPDTKTGFVYFTNSNNGLSIAESLIGDLFPDEHWSLRFLDYQRWDQPRRRARIGLQKSFYEDGGDASWQLLERIASEFPANVVQNETGRLVNFLRQEGKQELADAVEAWSASRF
jgi:CubicO group peptidase (beta-lactamase class C family)